ncbi:unnamed protein product [Rotaria sp. Silwood1]|nr:unnamed protein product [Rotaria sp. Silwood1]CAF3617967.1 unnamed protein product [Rotaria sp. Silwood1]CAF4577970.1 unnamed protein product [Rotaria sp. Silwood1]CAF4626349.1 unnamed protein product [Rotaria sp. Silwood1]CAF4632783.1 unnamed protein product [Rotaria sp. Silwood1]
MSEPPLPSARRQLLFAKYRPFLTTPFFFGFSAHVLAPKSFPRLLGTRVDLPLTNILWFGSHIGITMYLYTSKHLRSIHTFERLLYSMYGSAMFNFGTVLIMTIIRSIFPDKEALRLGIGLSISGALLFIGQRYVHYIDEVFDAIRFRAIK